MRELKFRAWDYEHGIMFQVGDDWGTISPLDPVVYYKEGQPVILEQFTGLHDKNGIEIYEGDIILVEGLRYIFADITTASELIPYIKKVKVIGNIHENPELLE